MSSKFTLNPVPESFSLLNRSYNQLKTKGHETLTLFKDLLEEKEISHLLHIRESEYESVEIEIFDLNFLLRLEIDLTPVSGAFHTGFIKTYFVPDYSGLDEIGINYRFDAEGRLYKSDNESATPDFTDISAFVIDFISLLIQHITTSKYITVPNQTFEE